MTFHILCFHFSRTFTAITDTINLFAHSFSQVGNISLSISLLHGTALLVWISFPIPISRVALHTVSIPNNLQINHHVNSFYRLQCFSPYISTLVSPLSFSNDAVYCYFFTILLNNIQLNHHAKCFYILQCLFRYV